MASLVGGGLSGRRAPRDSRHDRGIGQLISSRRLGNITAIFSQLNKPERENLQKTKGCGAPAGPVYRLTTDNIRDEGHSGFLASQKVLRLQ